MKLNTIIEVNNNPAECVLIEKMTPYKKSLKVYFEHEFNTSDLIMLVTSVTNTTSYGKIVPANEFHEAVCEWLQVDYIDFEDTESDVFAAYETICANSRMFNELF